MTLLVSSLFLYYSVSQILNPINSLFKFISIRVFYTIIAVELDVGIISPLVMLCMLLLLMSTRVFLLNLFFICVSIRITIMAGVYLFGFK